MPVSRQLSISIPFLVCMSRVGAITSVLLSTTKSDHWLSAAFSFSLE